MATTVNAGPEQVNITGIRAGDRNELLVTITNDGVPMDLTGGTVRAQARAKSTSPSAIDAVVSPADETKGQYLLAWPGDKVRQLLGAAETWTGVWDLEVVEAEQTIPITVATGSFQAFMDVTRDA